MDDYGKEVIIDLHECDASKFTRFHLHKFFKELCDLIGMERCELYWWDDLDTPADEKETEPHLVGTSAVQFIKTSNITIHTLDILRRVYLNVFSCKDFDAAVVLEISRKSFGGLVKTFKTVRRV